MNLLSESYWSWIGCSVSCVQETSIENEVFAEGVMAAALVEEECADGILEETSPNAALVASWEVEGFFEVWEGGALEVTRVQQ